MAPELSIYPHWTIGQLAKKAGCSVETVRHYERIGLLQEPRRTGGGYRLYGQDDLNRLGFIRNSRAFGFTQAEIRDLIAAMETPDGGAAAIRQAVRGRLEEVRADLCRLKDLERALARIAADCETAVGDAGGRLAAALCKEPARAA